MTDRTTRGRTELTFSEREVLAMICGGNTNAEIAELLDKPTRSVSATVARILTVLGADRRTEAVQQAYRRGLVGEVSVPLKASPPMAAGRAQFGGVLVDPTRPATPIRLEHGQWITVDEARTHLAALASAVHFLKGECR